MMSNKCRMERNFPRQLPPDVEPEGIKLKVICELWLISSLGRKESSSNRTSPVPLLK
jgi:hypothetical protein